MDVFDTYQRTDQSPGKHGEPMFSILNRSARPEIEKVRALLTDWHSHISPVSQPDLRGRLRTKCDGDFYGAFWELYLHEALRRMGAVLRPHPTTPDSSSHPDYLVEFAGEEFYLEARIAQEVGANKRAERARVDELYKAIDTKLKSPTFYLSVRVVMHGRDAPRSASLISKLSQWLSALNPDAVHEGSVPHHNAVVLPKYLWQHKDWTLEFTAIPKNPAARGKLDLRPIAVIGPVSEWVDSRIVILDALHRKAGKYGRPDKPYVIALLCLGHFVERRDVLDALFGEEQTIVRFSEGDSASTTPARRPNGLWHTATGPQFTRVSCVLAAIELHPWVVAEKTPIVIHNPWADQPLKAVIDWPSLIPDHAAGLLAERAATQTPHDALGLSRYWPFA